MTYDSTHRFGTRAIHAGQSPDLVTGSIMPPIYQASTYVQDVAGDPSHGYDYARVSNPTRGMLEANLAALEGGGHGIAFASGIAAIDALFGTVLSAGDHLICGADVYGGVDRMLRHVWARFGVEFDFVDTSDLDAVRGAIRSNTKLIHLETPSNPMITLADIASCAEIAREANALLSVDNTFATPYLQRPLELGADVVMHSTTKFLNGHSDVIGGALILDDDELTERLRFQRKTTGAVPGPFDCWLVMRGTKTLHLRMATHCANAKRVAEVLEEDPRVERTLYPGLPDHPGHALAARQMRDFGSMVSVDLGTEERARAFVGAVEVFALAESLGGVESLISIPALMTHASVPPERRAELGMTPGLVRLSVGVEDIADLTDDIHRALAVLEPIGTGVG